MLVIGLKLLRGIENPSFAYFDIWFFFFSVYPLFLMLAMDTPRAWFLFVPALLLYELLLRGSVHSLSRGDFRAVRSHRRIK